MNRIEEIKGRIENYKSEYLPLFNNNGEMQEWNDMFGDVQYLLSVLDHPQNFWDLYDKFQDKIAEKLILKDKLEQALMVLSYIAEEEQVGDAKLIHPPKETAQIALEQLRE